MSEHSPPGRQECRVCGAHTFDNRCSCCLSPELVPLRAERRPRRLRESELRVQPAPLPFTYWAP